MQELISVVIAAFQAESFIARSVSSVLAQSYAHWELVIAADDEVDYQQVLCSQGIEDARIRFTSTGRTGAGPSVARNTALAHARGNVIAVLDADDTFMPNKLALLLPHVRRHGVVTSNICLVNDVTGEKFPSLAMQYPEGVLSADDYIRANIHSYSLLMWDRTQVDVRWDATVPVMEDLVHGLCFYNFLNGIYYVPTLLHCYHKRPASITNSHETVARMIQSSELIIQRAMQDDFIIKNDAACDALRRFLRALIMCDKIFANEPYTDDVMSWYRFMQKNQNAFHAW